MTNTVFGHDKVLLHGSPTSDTQEAIVSDQGYLKIIPMLWNTSLLSYQRATGGTSGTGTEVTVTNFPATQPVSVADGLDVALGATTDAAVTTNASGTLSAKLRGLVSLLSPISFDSAASALKTIETTHNRIHAGVTYSLSGIQTGIAASTTAYFHWITGAKQIHFRAGEIGCDNAPVTVNFYEGSTVSANGTPLTPMNRKRSVVTAATLLAYSGPTVTGNGTLLESAVISPNGPGQSSGMAALFGQEWILDVASTHYLISVTNNSNQSLSISYNFLWYEV